MPGSPSFFGKRRGQANADEVVPGCSRFTVSITGGDHDQGSLPRGIRALGAGIAVVNVVFILVLLLSVDADFFTLLLTILSMTVIEIFGIFLALSYIYLSIDAGHLHTGLWSISQREVPLASLAEHFHVKDVSPSVFDVGFRKALGFRYQVIGRAISTYPRCSYGWQRAPVTHPEHSPTYLIPTKINNISKPIGKNSQNNVVTRQSSKIKPVLLSLPGVSGHTATNYGLQH